MKKSDNQKDFLKKLRKVDDLGPSLKPKEAMPLVVDQNLNPQKLISEIEQYLNEDSNSADPNLSSKTSGRQNEDSNSVDPNLSSKTSGRQFANPLADNLIIKYSGLQKIVDEESEKMAVDNLSAQEYFAQDQADAQADSQTPTPKDQPPTE